MGQVELAYEHWEGRHLNVWQRRFVITANGLRGCFQSKYTKRMILLGWSCSFVSIVILFFIGQLLVPDSIAFSALDNLSPIIQALGRSLLNWIIETPEVSVGTTYNLFFVILVVNTTFVSFITVNLAIPYLVTKDLASNAITLYASKAISRFDYFLGKLGTVVILLFMAWIGPILFTWLMGNLLSPDWDFFFYSRRALFHLLTYFAVCGTWLCVVALGISAISTEPKVTQFTWIGMWLIGLALGGIGEEMDIVWLTHFSMNYNLNQVGFFIFDLNYDIALAQEKLTIPDRWFDGFRDDDGKLFWESRSIGGSVGMLLVTMILAILILGRKAKPE